MLHRAASNACSWWWASHIRTKQSKWLDNNLQEMDEKVQYMVKLISEDGDSFAKRAESYYRKRPEIINFVEEFSRAYKALAERYDHISTELQNANSTIATVFPEQVQFAMEDEYDTGSPKSNRPPKPIKIPKNLPEVPKAHVPTFLKNLKKLRKDKSSLNRAPSKKMQPKKVTTNANGVEMSKDEAVTEIDKLQKGILALQTEKEFVKSSYENRLTKYWEIEKSITDMQEKVCSLQDEFSVSTAIEDNDARTLMASTALKSCQDTLAQLQEKQERTSQEAKLEYERVREVQQKLKSLKGEFFQNQNPSKKEDSTAKMLEQEADDLKQEIHDAETVCAKIREHFEINSAITLSVPELAEKIDELVTKVISLETAVSTQTALINRLRSETDHLQGNLRKVEEDKASLLQDSNKMNQKIRELERELNAVQDLNRNVENQNTNLQTHFTEANCNLDHLSEKLKCVKPLEEENEITDSSQEYVQKPPRADVEVLLEPPMMVPSEDSAKKFTPGDVSKGSQQKSSQPEDSVANSEPMRRASSQQDIGALLKQLNDNIETQDSSQMEDGLLISEAKRPNNSSQLEDGLLDSESKERLGDQEDEPNWQQLLANGLDERERILLTEYTSILRKYKETRKQLSELQLKKNDSRFEAMVQLRELKSTVAMKDEEIQSLRQKLRIMQESENSQQPKEPGLSSQSCSQPITSFEHQQITDLLQERNAEAAASPNASTSDRAAENLRTQRGEEDEAKYGAVDDQRTVSSLEEKFRRDIDELLEENLEFWLRFSGLFHQIQKFQNSIEDLQGEYSKLKSKLRNPEDSGSSKHNQSLKSDARPIYKHLREIQTELTVWIEQNMLLKDEVKYRLSSLSNIQGELTQVSETTSGTDVEFTSYQAAKFQGEVINMQQENNKVADELQAGLEHVKGLQVEVERSVSQMDEEWKLSSGSKHHPINPVIHSMSRTRIPLRSFLFGANAKKKKPSFFACINPTLHKQSSDMQGFHV